MTNKKEQDSNTSDERRAPSHLRRRIVLWIPAAVFASVAGPVVAAAFRFLRPRAGEVGLSAAAQSNWLPVAKVSDVTGAEPLRRDVLIEQRAGWSSTLRSHGVYVLPGKEARIVSAVCPHEGCEVDWDSERREFQCPCHDSVFGADGSRLGGPAQRGLDQLPSRLNGDTLEMQYAETQTASSRTNSSRMNSTHTNLPRSTSSRTDDRDDG